MNGQSLRVCLPCPFKHCLTITFGHLHVMSLMHRLLIIFISLGLFLRAQTKSYPFSPSNQERSPQPLLLLLPLAPQQLQLALPSLHLVALTYGNLITHSLTQSACLSGLLLHYQSPPSVLDKHKHEGTYLHTTTLLFLCCCLSPPPSLLPPLMYLSHLLAHTHTDSPTLIRLHIHLHTQGPRAKLR